MTFTFHSSGFRRIPPVRNRAPGRSGRRLHPIAGVRRLIEYDWRATSTEVPRRYQQLTDRFPHSVISHTAVELQAAPYAALVEVVAWFVVEEICRDSTTLRVVAGCCRSHCTHPHRRSRRIRDVPV